MDDEVEDLVGDVKYTDSQKSVTTSNVYSLDFTDSSSERHNSSGKETYVIEWDSDDSDKTFQMDGGCKHDSTNSIIHVKDKSGENTVAIKDKRPTHEMIVLHEPVKSVDQSVFVNLQQCSLVTEEIFTQTSKTIFELVHNDALINTSKENQTLETQTSFVSITENKTVNYRVHYMSENTNLNKNEIIQIPNKTVPDESTNCINYERISEICKACIENSEDILTHSLGDKSSIYQKSDTENKIETGSRKSSDEKIIQFIDDDYKRESVSDYQYDTQYENDSESDSDIEEDSLMERQEVINCRDNTSDSSEVLTSNDNEVEELRNQVSKSPVLLSPVLSVEPGLRRFGILTPLTEETSQRRESIVDMTPSLETIVSPNDDFNEDNIIINTTGLKVKMLPNNEDNREKDKLKLPSIHKNRSCPNSPNLNYLFTLNGSDKMLVKYGTLPCLYENQIHSPYDRWEIERRELASGESPHINGRNDNCKHSKDPIILPPIHGEGIIHSSVYSTEHTTERNGRSPKDSSFDSISINGKIKELKMSANKTSYHQRAKVESRSRSVSPTSASSPEGSRYCDAAEKGCDNLCNELTRRLRSSSWNEVAGTLSYLPTALEKFWNVIMEHRIADLIRQVTVHIESPRTQVARTACTTLAEILKNTNYTKKPDFYEAIASLLTKTGSFSRPVRRAANVALDDIVCAVDVTQSVTAICLYGVGHKSPLVRCASARLLVVCCALAEGGRAILRARPPTAAAARRHALRSLAELLHDKNTDTRKYAERLYSILRPLPNFEAYFLTDVDVELAARHMKKYDQLLLNNSKIINSRSRKNEV